MGRNPVIFEAKLIIPSLVRKCNVIVIVVLMTTETESLHCFFVCGCIKLNFGVRGKFRLLISSISSNS